MKSPAMPLDYLKQIAACKSQLTYFIRRAIFIANLVLPLSEVKNSAFLRTIDEDYINSHHKDVL